MKQTFLSNELIGSHSISDGYIRFITKNKVKKSSEKQLLILANNEIELMRLTIAVQSMYKKGIKI